MTKFKLLLVWVLLFTGVGANAADLLLGYQAINTGLRSAASLLGSNPRAAINQLESARDTYRRISPEIRAQKLIPGGNKAFDQARTAISRGSRTDLEAQGSQIQRILERALYEELFFEISAKRKTAPQYAGVLGRAFELPSTQQVELKSGVAKGQSTRVRALLETGIANLMQRSLQNASRNKNQVASFSSTVRAASAFLVVQDSPRVGGLSVGRFSEVLGLLASGDLGGYRSGVSGLLSQVTRFGSQARALLNSSRKTASQSVAKPKPTAKPTSKPVTKPIAKPITAKPVVSKPVVAAAILATPVVGQISLELTKAGIAKPQAERLARDLTEQGYKSFSSAIDAVGLKLSTALSDIQNARIDSGREAIGSAKAVFNQAVRPVVAVADQRLATRASTLFEATEAAYGLRPIDVTTLLGEVDAIRKWTKGENASALQGIVASAQPWWMGGGALGSLGLRGIVFLLVALMFAYPIYLLRLAFGGRNPYWNYIGVAMVLLFIPPLLEGIAWLGSLIAQGTELPEPVENFLNGLTSFSVLQNPLAQMAWAFTLLLTVIFATAGFRGIAAQFGLIRTRTPVTGEAIRSTNSSVTGNQINSPTNPTNSGTGRTIVEWDEEF
ncbi:MAG: hypothetical protein RLZZ156_715 [Deinococcota bacterium]|jgi:hypothetical protein